MGAGRAPVVFIGVPCYDTVAPELLEDWCRWMYHLGRRMPGYEFRLGIRTKTEQFRARNSLVDAARLEGADYLLMMDDDMIVNPFVTSGPTEEYSFVERLIAHDKDICGVLYYQRMGACAPVLMRAVGTEGYRFLRDDEVTHGLQPVDVAGGGCLLIKMRVFDKVTFPYFEPEHRFGTDIQLCRRAAEHGFEVWADTGIELGHVRSERVIVTSRNRQQYQLTDPIPGEIKKTFVATQVYEALIADALEYTGYASVEQLIADAQGFLTLRKTAACSDPEWYRRHAKERVARQVWYHTQVAVKRQMTEFILASIDHHRSFEVLDFGCGIGLTAFTLAQRGHRVTAVDIDGTGTYAFLQWRAAKAGLSMRFEPSAGGVPVLSPRQYDLIVAMDCLEHIAEWPAVVQTLAAHLRPTGVLFSNNAVLEDNLHPEHYPVDNGEFLKVCIDAHLHPYNQITYLKKEPVEAPVRSTYAEVAHSVA